MGGMVDMEGEAGLEELLADPVLAVDLVEDLGEALVVGQALEGTAPPTAPLAPQEEQTCR